MERTTKQKSTAKHLELYRDILEQARDLSTMKHISLESAILVLVLNELRQLHFHMDRFDASFVPKEVKSNE